MAMLEAGHTSVSPGVAERICSVAEPAGNERANSQHELLQSCDSSSDARMCDLSLIDGNNHHEEADTQPSDSSASIKPMEGLSSCLESAANDEDQCSQEYRPSSTEMVTNRTGEHGTEEGASSEERNNDSAIGKDG